MNTYEGMFLFDPSFATEWSNVETEIRRLMERAGAEIILCKKWDERRLAYEIRGRKRGCYALTYFKAPPGNIAGLERDAQLSESILRCLFMRADEVSEAVMHSAVPADVEKPSDEASDRGPGGADERETREVDREEVPGEPDVDAGMSLDDTLAEEESIDVKRPS